MPGAHALLSASGAERWIECPKSARLEETFEEVNTIYADEGTLAHEICQITLNVILHRITREEYRAKFAEIQKSELYNAEMLDHCEGFVAYVLEQYNQQPGNKILIEKLLNMRRWIPEGFGTSDVNIIRISEKKLTVIDLKYGKGLPVSAEENKQGMVYMLGALYEYEHIYDIEEVEFIIYQPRLDSISEYTISVETLLLWAEQVLRPAATLAWNDQGQFNPGDHCRFCRAKTTCRALHDHAISILKKQFDAAEAYPFENGEFFDKKFEGNRTEESLKPGPLLTDAEISDVLRKSDLFKNWLGAVEEFALQETVHKGKQWPGFKLVEGTSRRKIVDEQLVIFRLEQSGFDEPDYINKKLKSFEDLTKKIGKLNFEKILTPVILKPKGAPTLVELSDPRPAINSIETVQGMFADEAVNDLV